MLCIKSLEDVDQAVLAPGIRRAARDAVANLTAAYADSGRPYDPDLDGFVVVLDDPGDNEGLRRVLGCPLLEATLEGVSHDRECGCFVAVVLFNNDSGLPLIVPDAPGLDVRVRAKLVDNMPEAEVPR